MNWSSRRGKNRHRLASTAWFCLAVRSVTDLAFIVTLCPRYGSVSASKMIDGCLLPEKSTLREVISAYPEHHNKYVRKKRSVDSESAMIRIHNGSRVNSLTDCGGPSAWDVTCHDLKYDGVHLDTERAVKFF